MFGAGNAADLELGWLTEARSTSCCPRACSQLDQYREHSDEALAAFVAGRVQRGALELSPDPRSLVAWLSAPWLAGLVASPQVTLPWLWDLGDVRQLVYGLTFRHP